MKKLGRILLLLCLSIIGILLVGFLALKVMFNEEIPQGKTGEQANELALKMLEAIHHQEYLATQEIQWKFRGVNRYQWKLQQDVVEVYWKDYHVTLYTTTPEKSLAFKDGQELKGKNKEDAIAYATSNFNNDSFWLIAPFKIFDEGTKRQLIEEEGTQKLLVTYTSGGSTPGDSYLWEIDENYRPIGMKMWVRILPFKGVEAKWKDWQITDAGFLLPSKRTFFGFSIPISEVKVKK